MLEPRHVVTPLRDVLDQTHLRLGVVVARDAARRTVTLLDPEGSERELRYDRLVVAHGSVSRVLPIPGLADHAIGFKSLADAIWLRNHVIQCMEVADTTDDPATPGGAADVRVRGRRLRRPRGAGGAAGLRRRGDRALPTGKPAGNALDPGRGDGPGPARDRPSPGGLCPAPAARARDRHPARDDARGGDGHLGTDLDRRDASARAPSSGPPGWSPHPERPQPGAGGRRARSHRGRRPPAGARARTTSGRSATAAAVPDPAKPGRLCPPTSQHAIRQGRTAGRNVAASLGIGDPAPFTYKTLGAVREPRPLQGGGDAWAVHASAGSRRGGWRGPTT